MACRRAIRASEPQVIRPFTICPDFCYFCLETTRRPIILIDCWRTRRVAEVARLGTINSKRSGNDSQNSAI